MPSSQLIQCCVGRGVDVGSRDDEDDDDATTRLVQRYFCPWTIAIYDSDPKIMINISHCHRRSPPWRCLSLSLRLFALSLSFSAPCSIYVSAQLAYSFDECGRLLTRTFLTLSVHLTSSVSVCPGHSVSSSGYCFHLRLDISCL